MGFLIERYCTKLENGTLLFHGHKSIIMIQIYIYPLYPGLPILPQQTLLIDNKSSASFIYLTWESLRYDTTIMRKAIHQGVSATHFVI